MKHNRVLAAVVACLMVLAAVFIGLQGKPVSRDSSLYLTDKAGVISPAVEQQFVQLQKASSPRLSVAIVHSTGKMSTAAYCETLWNNWRLGTSDMLLLMVTGKEDYYFGYDTSSSFAWQLDANFDLLMETFLEPDFAARDYEQAILSFHEGLQHIWWQGSSTLPTTPDNFFDDYYGEYSGSATGISGFGLLIVIAFVVIFIAVVVAGSIGKKRPGSTVVYHKPSSPGSYRPSNTTFRPTTVHRPSSSYRPSTTFRPSTTHRPSSSSRPGGFGGGGRPSGGFGGGSRSGGSRSGGRSMGGGGRSGGMGGRGRR